jgi:hypothetical protein
MAKVIIIEECTQCPHFQDAYVSYGRLREWCIKEGKPVPWKQGGLRRRGSYPIPDFCSLPNKENNEHKDL